MSDWKWFFRVALLGFVGTVILSQVFSSTLEPNKRDNSLVLAITPNEVQAQAELLYPSESSIIPEDISVPLFPSVSSTTENIPAPETPFPPLPLITAKDIPTPETPLPPLPPISQPKTLTLREKFSLPSANTPQTKLRSNILDRKDLGDKDDLKDKGNKGDNIPSTKEAQHQKPLQQSVAEEPTNTSQETSAPVSEPPTNTPKTTSQQPPLADKQEIIATSLDGEQKLDKFSALFASPASLGMVAIGVAEGNYRLFIEEGNLYVERTSLYFGHTDPGNLSWGQVVTNYGPCSDQGRSGGNIVLAEQLCLQRSRSQLPTNLTDLQAAGIDPSEDIEALLNTADLYNQASPIHSRRFPEALAAVRLAGHTGVEAIAWARTASFYLNENQEIDLQQGENKASGLLGICARESQPMTEWECVYRDQLRRTKAIASVLDTYRQLSQVEEKGK